MRTVVVSIVSILIWMNLAECCEPGSRLMKATGTTGQEIGAQVAHTDRGRTLPTLYGFGSIGHVLREDGAAASPISPDDETATSAGIPVHTIAANPD